MSPAEMRLECLKLVLAQYQGLPESRAVEMANELWHWVQDGYRKPDFHELLKGSQQKVNA
jgi:hypothetical protein